LSDFTNIFGWTRDLLNSDAVRFPDDRLQRYADSAVNRLVDVYPMLGSYDSLSGTDLSFFDEAVGHLIAIRVRPATPKSLPISDLVRIHTQNTHFQYAEPTKEGGAPLEMLWLRSAERALARVSAIKAARVNDAAAFSPFVVAGPTRASRDAGGVETLLTTMLRILSADAVADFQEEAE
jgi:hypothetical protein